MVRTKNVTPSGEVYLEQQGGKKKIRLDRATPAVVVVAADQAEQGGQLRIASDHIAFRVRRLSSRARSTPARFDPSATTPPSSTMATLVALEPSTTPNALPASTTPAFTAPAPSFALPILLPHFRERDETEVRPLAADPRLLDLQRATAARVRHFRHVLVESWLPA
jgi:hypothetical protein